MNPRPGKPRARGLTSIRGPYYSPVGRSYLTDLLDALGHAVDSIKYAGGSFAVMDRETVRGLNAVAHDHDVLVSTGGFLERVVTWGDVHVEPCLRECRDLGFDIIEVSSGFISLGDDRFLELLGRVQAAGFRAIAEVGIQRGAGGASTVDALEQAGTVDPEVALVRAERARDAGAELILIESEGITEQVRE
ncbi:MAG: phosphosulfolactate synthase, partial [Longimicrobiales bacterium]